MFAALTPPFPEEAYHWDFAAHLDWSYFDHPGMIAWSIGLGRAIFGDVPFAIRFVPLLFSAGTAAVLADLARRVYGEAASIWAVLFHLLQPVTFFTSASGFPDSPMLFFWAAAMSLVWRALDSGRGAWWLGAGLALGLGMVSKYTIVFLGLSVLLYLLSSARDRRWLATPWPYLAAALALVAFLPVVCWNAHHDWASIRFQGKDRLASAREFQLKAFLKYVGLQWAAVVPLTLPLAAVSIVRAARSALPAERFLFWCFAPMMAFFAAVSWMMPTHVLWPLPCWLGVTVLMAGAAAQGAGKLASFYRKAAPWLAGVTAVLFIFASAHLAFLVPGIPQPSPVHGWDAVAARAAELRAGLPPDAFIVGLGRKYFVPSQLAFHLRAPSVVTGRTVLGQSDLQFDFWTDIHALAGRDALVVVEKGYEAEAEAQLPRAFRAVESAGTLTVPLRGGKPPVFLFYRARGYVPQPLMIYRR
jgi:dolichol-phosphate mannosyltransferase